MSKRFVTMGRTADGGWVAQSHHKTLEAATKAMGPFGGVVDCEVPWYREFRAAGEKSWHVMPPEVRVAFQAREF